MQHPELFVLRHGETEWNVEGRLQGALDSALTQTGRAQAKHQAALLSAAQIKAPLYSSPQGRALDTAHIIANALSCDVVQAPALREVSMGAWDGQLISDVAPDQPEDHLLWKFGAPRGEALDALRARLLDFVAQLEGPAILVTHGVTSRVLRGAVLGVPDDQLTRLAGGQGVVFRLKDGVQTVMA
ncbi:MAG: histidine phosphatase family protein [Pseudomonadota bacterium]